MTINPRKSRETAAVVSSSLFLGVPSSVPKTRRLLKMFSATASHPSCAVHPLKDVLFPCLPKYIMFCAGTPKHTCSANHRLKVEVINAHGGGVILALLSVVRGSSLRAGLVGSR